MSGALSHRSFCNSFCELQKKNFVIGWFRSTSSDADVAGTLPLRYNDSFDIYPLHNNDFYTPRLSRIDLSQTAFFIGYDFLRPGGSGSNPRPI